MKRIKYFLLVLSFNLLFSQVDTTWVRVYHNSFPVRASVCKIDNFGDIYIGGSIQRGGNKDDFLILKYDANGNLIDSAFFNNHLANDSERITAMTIDNSGNLYVTGWSKGIGTGRDYLTIKYNANLETLWARRWVGDSFDFPSGIAVDNEGNVLVAGMSQRRGVNYDYLTVKYGTDGNFLWQQYYAGSDSANDSASAIITDNNGDIYVTGYISHNGSEDFLTIKYNPNGETIWTRRYNRASEREDKGLLLNLDQSENIFVVGSTEAGNGFYDVGMIKYNPNGDTLWLRNYNRSSTNDDDLPRAVISDANGNLYVTGTSWDGSDEDFLVLKYDGQGNRLWDLFYDHDNRDEAVSLCLDNQGNVYVGGNSYDPTSDFDFLLVKYSPAGERKWVKRYNREGFEELIGIGIDNSGDIYLVGNFSEGDIGIVKYHQIRDIGVDSIFSPTGEFDPYTTRVPRARVINYGGTDEHFICRFTISQKGQVIYQKTVDTLLSTLDTIELQFPGLLFTIGDTYTTKCSILMNGDENPANDFKMGSFVVRQPTPAGWVMKPYLLYGPSQKPVKYGGSLVGVRGRYIYAFKGNNTNEFQMYNISGDSWIMRCSIPYAPDGKRKVKNGAALAYDGVDSVIYAIKGGNTLEFWKYFTNHDTWHQVTKGLPLGYSGKKVKYGSGLVYLRQGQNRYIYFLKGSRTREFYCYHIQGDSWITLPDVPLGESQKDCKAGSCIIRAGDYIYCVKSYYNEFFAYDYDKMEWQKRRSVPLVNHLVNKKRVKDGAAMAYDGTRRIIYLFKGGNTDEFWGYFPEADTWIELPPIPIYPYNKKVKSGGALTQVGGNIYGLKGNRTLEFWMFSWDTTDKRFLEEDKEESGGEVFGKNKNIIETFASFLYPNPNSGKFSLSYSLSRGENLVLRIYDATGRLLKKVEKRGEAGDNNWAMELKLPKGIYFLELKSKDGIKLKKKIVIE
ncbi:MAG: T9SS type A sorting domain-containing protein [candidate division WOR-3 bacterium]